MQYLLAHDLGTSGDKATLFTTEGKLVASAVTAYGCHYFGGNCAEQNPEDWYAAVCRATRTLTEKIDPAEIVGLSFSGHMMGAVLLDSRGALLRPAMIWADQRATEEQGILTERVGDENFYRITGNRNNPTNSICKIMWSLRHDGLSGKLAHSLNAKDYLIYRLTGAIGTDYSDGSGTGALDIHSFAWSREILEAAQVPLSVMPELHSAVDLAGTVCPQAAKESGLLAGTPVYWGLGDGTAAAVGSGVTQPGRAYLSLGTSAWISYLDDVPLLDPQARTFNLAGIRPGRVYPIGPMQSACASYNWMRDQLCRQEKAGGENVYAAINGQIHRVPVGANGVLFLPYLMGERSPWWDARAKGAFLGLSLETTHEEMLRAVMEGISMNLGLILQILREKRDITSLRIVGGGAREPIWRQMLADVLNVRIEKLNLLEEGCSLGAAMAAGLGAGAFADGTAIEKFLKVDHVAEPDPERMEQYGKLMEKFREGYERLKGFY